VPAHQRAGKLPQRLTVVKYENDFSLDGTIVSKTIMAHVPSDTPILIHSMNPADAPKKQLALNKSGDSVASILMCEMTEEKFCEWLDERPSPSTSFQ
jgi:hypothetical protein